MFTPEMMEALEADGRKMRQLTGQDHTPVFLIEDTRSPVERALSLAVALLAPGEPPDSRAVSPEFVALAAVDCGLIDAEVMKVIDTALARLEGKAEGMEGKAEGKN